MQQLRMFYLTDHDNDRRDESAIEPCEPGKLVSALTVRSELRRPPDNLRRRTERMRDGWEDLRYLHEVDRALLLTGPPTLVIKWSDVVDAGGDGIVETSTDIWLVSYVTAGQKANSPPVESREGTIVIRRADNAPLLVLVSKRRAYAGGDGQSYTAIANTTFGVGYDDASRQLTAFIVPGVTTCKTLRDMLTTAPSITAAFDVQTPAGVADTDLVLASQEVTYAEGTVDAEVHVVTPAALAAFFATASNRLQSGDTLGIWYAALQDGKGGGRRESLLENGNVDVPVTALFNSRLSPEKLVGALPLFKAIGGKLYVYGRAFALQKNTSVPVGTLLADEVLWTGGGEWADGTTNPSTSVGAQLGKIIDDLTADGVAPAVGDGAARIGAAESGPLQAGTIRSQLDQLAASAPNGLAILPGFSMESGADDVVIVYPFVANFSGTYREFSTTVNLPTATVPLPTTPGASQWFSIFALWNGTKVIVDVTDKVPDLIKRTITGIAGSVYLGRVWLAEDVAKKRFVRSFVRNDRRVVCPNYAVGLAYEPDAWMIGRTSTAGASGFNVDGAIPPGVSAARITAEIVTTAAPAINASITGSGVRKSLWQYGGLPANINATFDAGWLRIGTGRSLTLNLSGSGATIGAYTSEYED